MIHGLLHQPHCLVQCQNNTFITALVSIQSYNPLKCLSLIINTFFMNYQGFYNFTWCVSTWRIGLLVVYMLQCKILVRQIWQMSFHPNIIDASKCNRTITTKFAKLFPSKCTSNFAKIFFPTILCYMIINHLTNYLNY